MSKQKVLVKSGNYQLVPTKKVLVGKRCREKFDRLGELAESIQRFGLDNPLTVAPHPERDGCFVLVAGERRYRALLLCGVSEMPVVVRGDMNGVQRKEFELEENLQRDGLSWDEQIEGERQLHELKKVQQEGKEEGGKWQLEDTARTLNTSRSTVARDIAFAEELLARPELKEMVKDLPLHAAIKRVGRIKEAEEAGKKRMGVEGFLKQGDSQQLLQSVGSASVGLVLTDPPFGIPELERQRKEGRGSPQRQQLQKEDNLTEKEVGELGGWLFPEVERVLVPGGHFYLFCCQQLWGTLRAAALAAGLEIQEYPLVWWKGRSTAPGRGYLYTPCCEPIMFGWKPPRKRLLQKNLPALQEVLPETKGVIHPFQKPQLLLGVLIQQSTLPGEVVLDPFCGSGSTVVAALSAHRVGVGFDIDKSNLVFPLASKWVDHTLRFLRKHFGTDEQKEQLRLQELEEQKEKE